MSARSFDERYYGLDGNRLALFDSDLLEHAGGRGRNLGVHFIRGDFKKRLIPVDGVTRFFQPFRDGALEDAFSHLGHDNLDGHKHSPSGNRRQILIYPFRSTRSGRT